MGDNACGETEKKKPYNTGGTEAHDLLGLGVKIKKYPQSAKWPNKKEGF